MNVEVLSVQLGEHPNLKWVECSKKRWAEVMRDYPARFSSHAANLAAHGWDILLVDGRVLITHPSPYSSTEPPSNAHWLGSTRANPDDASPELLATLYEMRGRGQGHKRLFELSAAECVPPHNTTQGKANG